MKTLLDRYRTGNITPEELDKLSALVEDTSDDILADILGEEWKTYTLQSPHTVTQGRRPVWHIAGRWLGIAASLLVIATVSLGISYLNADRKIRQLASYEVTFASGNDGQSAVTLPDGTSVILNARSSITYPADFGMKNRHVTMTGEGFFDVAKDPDNEFTLSAPGMDITVHGTRFNVYAYPESDVSEMSLVEGSVSVRTGDSVTKVRPNEKVCLTRSTGRVNLLKTDNDIETLWMKDRIIFIHEPLYKVFDVLQRCFGVQIECSENISLSDRYTGTFKDRKITDILEILKMHYGFSYEYRDNHITITHN